MGIEARFDVPFVAEMALREKQIQQNYRPIIGVHKWFARRPGTLFRSLVLSEFVDAPLQQSFFNANDLAGVRVADPFMGGGTPVVEANRVGCDVTGLDINPMSTWIVRQEIQDLDLDAYQRAAEQMIAELGHDIDQLYRTNCSIYGDASVPVKCFLWVKVIDCARCDTPIDLFPSYVVAENKRHPKNVIVCSHCGDLNEVDDRHQPGNCQTCDAALIATGPARRGRCPCPECGHINTYPRDDGRPIRHRMFAMEYFNPSRRDTHRGRFFKKPDAEDLRRAEEAESRWIGLSPRFVPDEDIPMGDETRRLHRWNYRSWRDLFSPRQLLGLELGCRLIAQIDDKRIRHALATNLSDLLRYQNMLCRYHAGALKCLDVFLPYTDFQSDRCTAKPTCQALSAATVRMWGPAVGQTSSPSSSRQSSSAMRRSRSRATVLAKCESRYPGNASARNGMVGAELSNLAAAQPPSWNYPRTASTGCSPIRPTSAMCNTPN